VFAVVDFHQPDEVRKSSARRALPFVPAKTSSTPTMLRQAGSMSSLMSAAGGGCVLILNLVSIQLMRCFPLAGGVHSSPAIGLASTGNLCEVLIFSLSRNPSLCLIRFLLVFNPLFRLICSFQQIVEDH
jgi:hypothetical protein